MPYCSAGDLLLDPQLGVPVGLNKDTYVQSGADVIDAKLGRVYKTPFLVDWTQQQKDKYGATVKLLKVLNQHLSSGMLICAMAMAGEDNQLHAYGASLIKLANDILDQIVRNEVFLEGAEDNPNLTGEGEHQNPRGFSYTADATSAVENFYDMVFGYTPPGFVMDTNLFRPR